MERTEGGCHIGQPPSPTVYRLIGSNPDWNPQICLPRP